MTDDDLRQLALALIPFLAEAHQHGHSMVTMELDPVKLFGVSYKGKDPRMVVALALGPSAPVLRQAIEMARNPQ